MLKITKKVVLLASPILLAACASIPSGPSHLALPGSGKSFEQFHMDETTCRQYARDQLGGETPDHVAAESGVRSAAVGTAIGAVAGAVINGRRGAGVGAGTGLLFGALVGSDNAARSGYEAQRRYDYSYLQCMYAKGNQVPVAGRFSPRASTWASQPPMSQ